MMFASGVYAQAISRSVKHLQMYERESTNMGNLQNINPQNLMRIRYAMWQDTLHN